MIAAYNPWFAIAIPFIIIIYSMIQNYYRMSSRELKRLDALTRSPLFAHFSETLMGLSTIRAYKHQEEFIQGNYMRVDANNRPYFILQCSQRWLGERLEILGALIVFLTAMLGVAARSSLNPSVLGLSLSYAVMITQILSWLVRQIVESENNLNSVER
jgi:ABC-type multidrug transport system fused ATPase/permease subunit